jgi:hypothetical protein
MSESNHFVLCRLNWSRTSWGSKEGRIHRLPGSTLLTSYDRFPDAESECHRREEKLRREINPFLCGAALGDLTHLGELPFRDWVQDCDIEPVLEGGVITDWQAWWVQCSPSWTTQQRDHVWEGLTKVRFHAVESRPKRNVLYAVKAINWQYDDSWNVREPGGEVLAVYRTHARAMQALKEAEEQARSVSRRSSTFEIPDNSADQFFWEDHSFREDHNGQQVQQEDAPFFEIVVIEYHEGEA